METTVGSYYLYTGATTMGTAKDESHDTDLGSFLISNSLSLGLNSGYKILLIVQHVLLTLLLNLVFWKNARRILEFFIIAYKINEEL